MLAGAHVGGKIGSGEQTVEIQCCDEWFVEILCFAANCDSELAQLPVFGMFGPGFGPVVRVSMFDQGDPSVVLGEHFGWSLGLAGDHMGWAS